MYITKHHNNTPKDGKAGQLAAVRYVADHMRHLLPVECWMLDGGDDSNHWFGYILVGKSLQTGNFP